MRRFGSEYWRSFRVLRLLRYVGVGLACGGAYALVDWYLDHALQGQSLSPVVQHFHRFVDFVLPLVAGGLFGAASHFLQLRSARARGEAERANALHARLTRVERDQAVWVVVASTLHEIKNPLHTLGLLLTEVTELGPEEQTTRVELTQRMAQQLDRVRKNVEALRGLSVRAAPHPRRLELCAEARRVADDLLRARRAPGAELSVRGSQDALVEADPAHLRLILENLIENALEAVEDEEHAAVALDVEVRPGEVRLRVSDSGPGVPQSLRGDLFEPLATSKTRGLGLGLPIARALARAMGGDVTLETEQSPASTFVLSLPGART
jgi:signal transduction histidine kinase